MLYVGGGARIGGMKVTDAAETAGVDDVVLVAVLENAPATPSKGSKELPCILLSSACKLSKSAVWMAVISERLVK